MTGLLYGVPQIICAWHVFERKYNADTITKLGVGISITQKEFTAKAFKSALQPIKNII